MRSKEVVCEEEMPCRRDRQKFGYSFDDSQNDSDYDVVHGPVTVYFE